MCVFFDIRKAFDSVPHQALLNKLSSLDILFILLRWLTGYRTSRLQRVVLGGVSSPWLPVKSGVPQGSVLGPLLFLSYIKYLSSLTFSSGTNILMFADDIVLYKSISSQRDSSEFQGDADLVANWVKSNHLVGPPLGISTSSNLKEASKQWTESADTLNSLCLPSLCLRRNYLKLLFMYINSCVFCPYGLLQFHPNPNLRFSHEKRPVQPFARTSAFFNSYCVSSITAWNSLPSDIVLCTCTSISAFKNALKLYYCL